jgi:hypothetical protein
MNNCIQSILSAMLLATAASHRLCAQGTEFTYQGRLDKDGTAASGNYDFIFSLHEDGSAGAQLADSLTNSALAVAGGLFTANLDFGDKFAGQPLWLEIAVRTNGVGDFTKLSPRQRLAPTPYAITAGSANNLLGLVSAGQITGSSPNALSLTNPANVFRGTFSGNFGSISNLNLGILSNGIPSSTANQLQFVDTPGAEQIVLRAQHDLNLTVVHDAAATYGHDLTELVIGNRDESVAVNATEVIGNTFSRTVGLDQVDSIGRHFTVSAGGRYTLDASQAISFFSPAGVGIGASSPDSELHIQRGSAGTVTASTSALLTLENNGAAFIHCLTPATNNAGILFGTPDGSLDASIRYNNSGLNRELSFRTLNSERMRIGTNGFVGIGTTAPANNLHVNGGITCVALTQTSDRNAKEDLIPVAPLDVLSKVVALPISTWSFKGLEDGRHMGPMAQDFYEAFGLGNSDKTITAVDPSGVALAAIQGLNQKLDQKETEITELKQRLEKLEQILHQNRR